MSSDPMQRSPFPSSDVGRSIATSQSSPKSSMLSQLKVDAKTPLQFIPGIGSQRLELFEKLGIRKAQDLLFYFPRSYQEVAAFQSIVEMQSGDRTSVMGQIVDMDQRLGFQGRSTIGVLLAVEGGGYVRCVWFNQPFRRHMYSVGMRALATGLVKSTGAAFEMRHPDFTIVDEKQEKPDAKPQPVYPLTEGLQQRHISQAIASALDGFANSIEEALPESIRLAAAIKPLPYIGEALRAIHQPESLEDAHAARYRFIFQELFVYQLALAMRRYRLQHDKPAPEIHATPMIHARILKRFSFELTADQAKAIEDVRTDMAKSTPMNRLIQGDVGSGKTAIAQYAMLNAVANKHQAALMAPTELLARQHYSNLVRQLAGSQVMVEMLTGSSSPRERHEILQRIGIGTVDIVVGTQSLLSEHVQFESLGLVVIDEQHKFGVEQRANLRHSRIVPHYLVLSATPIPRTIAMTVFGDLDVSVLRDKPAGRSVVHTYLGNTEQQTSWWEFVAKQVQSGRQAYVIIPRVESDESSEVLGAEQVYEHLRNGPLSRFRIDLLHGRMSGQDKQLKLDAFSNGHTQVLVSTTLVEVGIDIANATVMTILDADRLGLAQLHQLRGRVSRGSFPGYVCLFAKQGTAPEENARLSILASTDDGFRLAEHDLQLRGPGDLLGTRQVGLPPLRIADLVRDADILKTARQIAIDLVTSDPGLDLPQHALLKKQVIGRHGSVLALGDVG